MLLPIRNRWTAWLILATLMLSTILTNQSNIAAHSTSGSYAARLGQRPQLDATGPLTVTPTLDTTRAATATLTTDGLTLQATAADGTMFTLTIPKDAIPDSEYITMTPIGSVSDLPFAAGLAGAVQLEPGDLGLVKSATLVIATPVSLSIEEQSPFCWSNSGTDFHLFPEALDASTMTLVLDHFGGYGIARGSVSEREFVTTHQPAALAAQREQRLEIAFEETRDKIAGGLTKKQTKKARKKLAPTLEDIFQADLSVIESELLSQSANQTVLPQSAGRALCGLIHLLQWARNMNSAEDASGDELAAPQPLSNQEIINAITTLENQYAHQCQGDILAIGRLLQLATLVRTIAAARPTFNFLANLPPGIVRLADTCGALELDFKSTIDGKFEFGDESITMHAQVLLFLDTAKVQLVGEAPLKHEDFEVDSGCSVLKESADSTCKVILNIGRIGSPDCDSDETIIDYDLTIDLGRPTETLTFFCPFKSPPPFTDAIWLGQFNCSHRGDLSGSTFRVKGWEQGSGNVLAKKDYEGAPCKENPFDEDTKIELRRVTN